MTRHNIQLAVINMKCAEIFFSLSQTSLLKNCTEVDLITILIAQLGKRSHVAKTYYNKKRTISLESYC